MTVQQLRNMLVDIEAKFQSRNDIAPREMATILAVIAAITEAINGD